WLSFATRRSSDLSTGGGKIFASYLKDATSRVKQYNSDGELEREIELPGIGTAGGFGAKEKDSSLYYTFTSYIDPGTIYKYDINYGESELYMSPKIHFDF